jgi:epoxide hydrolase
MFHFFRHQPDHAPTTESWEQVEHPNKDTSSKIRPFRIAVPESELEDLKYRLKHTRWPEEATVPDWSQGVPLSTIKDLCAYWQHEYDWRECEKRLNRYPQFVTEIDGVDIHFFHIRSKHENAIPMIMTGGWPDTIIALQPTIEPLTDPTRHSGKAKDAFHLILPSLPGFGFSGKPAKTGWGSKKTAKAWLELMDRLGYLIGPWVAQGGDWGADVVAELAADSPPSSLLGIHMSTAFFDARKETHNAKMTLTEGEKRALALLENWERAEWAYLREHETRPQTVGYALADSPVGLLAWIYEKLVAWSQDEPRKHKDILTMISKKDVIDNIMVFWVTNTITSSMRLYWENGDNTALRISIPVGVSQFLGENSYVPRHWAERYYSNIVHWRELNKGGHFSSWTVPELFVKEVRECFAHVR